jgi:peptide/nickel transport system substrate-binding protein
MAWDGEDASGYLKKLMKSELSRRQFLNWSATTAAIACTARSGATWSQAPAKSAGATRLLRIGAFATINDVLDPIKYSHSNHELEMQSAMFDPLLRLDNGFAAQPGVIESWEASKDGRTWTLKLRRGVTFHDGASLTIDDIVYSIQRNLDPKSTSAVAPVLSPYLKPVDVKAVDKSTVQLSLSSPYGFIPQYLGNPFMRVIKKDTTDFTNPVGTGPFVFKSWQPGQSFEATANRNYWGGAPKVDISIIGIPDDSARLAALMADDVDVLERLVHTQISTIQKDARFDLYVLKDTTLAVVDMDLKVAPFNDPRVVAALKAAVDREQIVRTAYYGQASIGYDHVIPSSDPMFDTSQPKPVRDVAKAKSLLSQAGHSSGLDLEFIVSPLPNSQLPEVAAALQQQWKEAGINVKLTQWPAATFYDNVWLKKPFYIYPLSRRLPDTTLGYTSITNGRWNATHYSNPEVDKAIEGARATANIDEQKRFYAKAQQLLAAGDGRVIPAAYHSFVPFSKKVHGVTWNRSYFLEVRDASID